MLTRLRIKNFKTLADADIELGQNVVFIGPNNSGKTTALQALALWAAGMAELSEFSNEELSDDPFVTLNIRDLVHIPVPDAESLFFKKIHQQSPSNESDPGKVIEIEVWGMTNGLEWSSQLSFSYVNSESISCHVGKAFRSYIRVSLLPPMGGIASVEPLLQPGRINVLAGEGQTSQILRNLCYQLYERKTDWGDLKARMHKLFGFELSQPKYSAARGELYLSYKDPAGVELDISAAGRGAQQTLLLLAHLYNNPGTVLLLDEPDAHLEVLRQRQNYRIISDVAAEVGSQIIATSHSEVIMNEAAERDVVIAFVGQPHRLNDHRQVVKALMEIGYDQYVQAEERGWVLYLEGSTDLAILQSLAHKLGHPAREPLASPFVKYVTNLPSAAEHHFRGLLEAKPDLVGVAIYDRLAKNLPRRSVLHHTMWRRNEIENYLLSPDLLRAYAAATDSPQDSERRLQAMNLSIARVEGARRTLHALDPWSHDAKASEVFDQIMGNYFAELGIENLLRKSGYHEFAQYLRAGDIDPEITEKLDLIAAVAASAKPRG